MGMIPNDPLLDADGYDPALENPLHPDYFGYDELFWAGLGLPSKGALNWVVRNGGHLPFNSDIPYLRRMERDGLVHCENDVWRATEHGVAVWRAGQ